MSPRRTTVVITNQEKEDMRLVTFIHCTILLTVMVMRLEKFPNSLTASSACLRTSFTLTFTLSSVS